MKISIGNVKDKNISSVLEHNIENGYAIFSDGKEYYVEVLTDSSCYKSPDCVFIHIPSGMYKIKNNIVYTVDDVQSWINL